MIRIATEDGIGTMELPYDPRAHGSAEAAARELHRVLTELCKSMGQSPEIELMLQTPEESHKFGCGRNWRVCWEAGPYQWAIGASMQIWGEWGFTEPHYSFDLCFNDEPMEAEYVEQRLQAEAEFRDER